MATSASKPFRVGVVCALAGLLAAGIAAVALDALAPGAGPLVQPVSSFVHTDYAWLWHFTAGSGAAGILILAGTLRSSARTRAFTTALAATGVGLAAAGACSADLWFPWERLPTLGGGLHVGAVAVAIVALSVAMAVRARSLPAHFGRYWCRAGEWAYWSALSGGSVYLGVGAVAGRPPHWFGLCERLVLCSAWAWSIFLALGALRLDADDEAAHVHPPATDN